MPKKCSDQIRIMCMCIAQAIAHMHRLLAYFIPVSFFVLRTLKIVLVAIWKYSAVVIHSYLVVL